MRRLVILLTALNLSACAHGGGAPETAAPTATPAPRPVATPEARQASAEAQGLSRQGDDAGALVLYRRAWEGGVRGRVMAYSAACSASLAKQPEEALVWLARAADEGFDDAKHLDQDTDLDGIRNLPGFAPLRERIAVAEAQQYEAADPALRDELLKRAEEDQRVRRLLVASQFKDEAVKAEMLKVDASNTAFLKDVVAKRGWPGKALVGVRAAFSAWLMVQHADQDVAFQEQVLPMLEKAVAQGEGSAKELAYLTDRVLVNTGKPQRYATQLEPDEEGKMVPKRLEDPANVNARRAGVGLDSVEEYIQTMERLKAAAGKPQP